MSEDFKQGLAPVAHASSRLLILGSLPSDQSLQKQEYYANPRNHFWGILAAVYGAEPGDAYADKLAFLREHGIALWDVITAARRPGSLDSAIREERLNDLPGLLREYPGIRRVLLNGGTAMRLYRKHFADLPVPTVALPSSSPMPGRGVKRFEEKCIVWREALLSPTLPG